MIKRIVIGLVVIQTFTALGLLTMWDEVASTYFGNQPVGKVALGGAVLWVAGVSIWAIIKYVRAGMSKSFGT